MLHRDLQPQQEQRPWAPDYYRPERDKRPPSAPLKCERVNQSIRVSLEPAGEMEVTACWWKCAQGPGGEGAEWGKGTGAAENLRHPEVLSEGKGAQARRRLYQPMAQPLRGESARGLGVRCLCGRFIPDNGRRSAGYCSKHDGSAPACQGGRSNLAAPDPGPIPGRHQLGPTPSPAFSLLPLEGAGHGMK